MAEESTNIRILIQTKGDGQVYLYRSPSENLENNEFSTISSGMQIIASKMSSDKMWYYIPAYKAWIKTESVTLISNNPSPDISNDEVRRAPVGGTDVTDRIFTATNTIQNTTTSTRAVDNGTDMATSIQDIVPEKKIDVVIPDLKTHGPATGIRITDVNSSASSKTSENYKNWKSLNINGIFGMPYQFMPSVDRRLADNPAIGRKFAEKILTRNNLIYLSPCVQDFMHNSSSRDKGAVLTALTELVGGGSPSSTIVNNLKKYDRYYTAINAIADYYNYVNDMCRAVAMYMGIGNENVRLFGNNKRIKEINWMEALDSNFQKYFGTKSNVIFYVDGLNSVSESFSNDTRESSLASSINGLSDEAKEINFVTKSDFGTNGMGNMAQMTGSGVESLVSSFTNGKGVLSAILGNTNTLLSGGKLAFPEMWSDSAYDRSYSINFKFRTPEADQVSIYLNIIVPYIHLLAMTAPHDYNETANNTNGYREPFLVRASFKGLFSVDMGLISDLSCDKGSEGTWSVDGLPTQLDVTMTIRDLYKSFYISYANDKFNLGLGTHSDAYRFIGNDGLTDFLMNSAGVNLAVPVINKKAYAYVQFQSQKYTNLFTRLGNNMKQDLARSLDNLFGN